MNYAVIQNNKVVNLVFGDYDFLSTIYEVIVEIPKTGVMPRIGARYNGERFEPAQKHSKWIWNEERFEYEPPSPKPEGIYRWDETAGDWVEHLAPYPSWTYNADTGNYDPPKAYPEDDQPYQWDEATLDWVEIDLEA